MKQCIDSMQTEISTFVEEERPLFFTALRKAVTWVKFSFSDSSSYHASYSRDQILTSANSQHTSTTETTSTRVDYVMYAVIIINTQIAAA